MKTRYLLSALALSAGVCSVSLADVTGKATYDGAPPKPKEINMQAVADCAKQHADPVYEETVVVGEKGELKNVVVYVKKEEGKDLGGAAPTEPGILDQKGCMYSPHVLPVMAGQSMKIRNSDGFLHNVHGLGKDNAEFNFPQQSSGDADVTNKANKAVETYKVKCDVHPWMGAWIVVLDHPFFGATGDNGEYAIKNLKDGEYTLVAWHERLGTQEQKVTVKDGKATADFKFKPKSKAAADIQVPKIIETVATSKKADDDCCEDCKKTEAVVAKDAKGAQPQAAAAK
jgi:plastocyanin